MLRKRDADRDSSAKAARLASLLGIEFKRGDAKRGTLPEGNDPQDSQAEAAPDLVFPDEAAGQYSYPSEQFSQNAGTLSADAPDAPRETEAQILSSGDELVEASSEPPRIARERSRTHGQASPAGEAYT